MPLDVVGVFAPVAAFPRVINRRPMSTGEKGPSTRGDLRPGVPSCAGGREARMDQKRKGSLAEYERQGWASGMEIGVGCKLVYCIVPNQKNTCDGVGKEKLQRHCTQF